MRASTILAIGAAGLVAAAPTSCPNNNNNNSGDDSNGDVQTFGNFYVNKFVFGCTAGCFYTFDLDFQNDPEQYKCSGSLDDKDYVKCEGTTANQAYYAYIDTTQGKNLLKLQYEVTDTAAGVRTNTYGEQQVYAATSGDAAKQKENFSVAATTQTKVA
jgi:hypothetical protein